MIRNPHASLRLPTNIVQMADVSRALSQPEVTVNWNKEFPTINTHNPYPESRDLPFQTSARRFETGEFTFERTTIDTKDKIPAKSYTDQFTGASRNDEIRSLFNRPSYKDVVDRDPRYKSQDVRSENSFQTWVSGNPPSAK